MSEIKLEDYAKANNLTEEKTLLYLRKGYLKGIERDGVWHINPSPMGLFLAKVTDITATRSWHFVKAHSVMLVVPLAVILLIYFNPNEYRHRDYIVKEIRDIIKNEDPGKFTENGMGVINYFGIDYYIQLSTKGVIENVNYHNYVLASTVTYDVPAADGSILTIGFAGMVFKVNDIMVY